MDTFSIKKIGKEDVDTLRTISINTFRETFEASNTAENMEHYIATCLNKEQLLREMANEHSAFYFAYANDHDLTGYLKINYGPAQTDLNDDASLEVERIYILKSFQGKNAGRFLFRKALEIAREMPAKYVWLGVWEHNHKAIQFYEKHHFYPFSQHVFKLGDDEQTDILMRLDFE